MAKVYRVSGMTCGGCARSVEAAIRDAAPDATVKVDLATASVIVEGASDEQVKTAVDAAGFGYQGAA
jgi:copper chaperone